MLEFKMDSLFMRGLQVEGNEVKVRIETAEGIQFARNVIDQLSDFHRITLVRSLSQKAKECLADELH